MKRKRNRILRRMQAMKRKMDREIDLLLDEAQKSLIRSAQLERMISEITKQSALDRIHHAAKRSPVTPIPISPRDYDTLRNFVSPSRWKDPNWAPPTYAADLEAWGYKFTLDLEFRDDC